MRRVDGLRRRLRVIGEMMGLSYRTDRRLTVVAGLLVAVSAGAVAVTGLTQRWLVDAAGGGADTAVRVLLAAALGATAHVVITVTSGVQVNLRDDLSDQVEVTLNHEILSTCAAIPTIEHLERPEYLNRMAMLRAGGASGTRALAVSCWVVVETAAAMISLGLSVWLLGDVHPALALLAVPAAAPLLLTNRGNRLVRRALDETAALARHEQALHELCTSPDPGKEVRVAGNGTELSRRARTLWDTARGDELTARLRGAGWQLAGWACFIAAFTATIGVVAVLAGTGRASVGDIVLVITLASRLRDQLQWALFGLTRLTEAGRITEHYLWLRGYAAANQATGQPAPTTLNHGITLTGVSFAYPDSTTRALRDLNVHLPAGAVIGLVGINGAGKSTLVKLLTGIYQPVEGAITVDAQPLSSIHPAEWAAVSTGAFQDFAKPQLLAREAVGIGDVTKITDRTAIETAVNRAGAADTIAALPHGLDTQLGRLFDGVELSHGQWQKLALGRTFMRPAPLLRVLDEPTAALDPQAEHDLFERFTAHTRATTDLGSITLLVSHRFSTVHMANHIIVLSDGQIIEQGSHADLLKLGGEYSALYTTQAASYA